MESDRSDKASGEPPPAPHLVTADEVHRLLQEFIQIGIALTSERDLDTLLERIVREARRITRAEAATLFLRDGDQLRFKVVQNDALTRQRGRHAVRRQLRSEPLTVDRPSIAAYVAQTGRVVNVADAYALPADAPFQFDARDDARTEYRTCSVLAVPLQDASGFVLGVLELINALDASGAPIAFDPRYEAVVRALASHAAVAIRNVRLEELSFRDPLTEVYNRRYLKLRIEEEAKRHARFGEPLSIVLVDVDHFKEINDTHGHGAGDQVLRDIAQILVQQSRGFTIVTRYGGDEFAVLLANTGKGGALTYAQRMRAAIERHPFPCGQVTVSVGVATLPDDSDTTEGMVESADDALYEAKRQGRNTVSVRPR